MNDIDKDNHIADFVDGKPNASLPDPELVQLKETILRLKQTLPNKPIDSATSKQMLVRLKARIKREEETAKIPFWKKLFDFQSNPQVGMLLTIATVLILAIITIPSLQTSGGGTVTGAANGSTPILIIGGLILIVLGIYITLRRK
jgi:hypothetical protein